MVRARARILCRDLSPKAEGEEAFIILYSQGVSEGKDESMDRLNPRSRDRPTQFLLRRDCNSTHGAPECALTRLRLTSPCQRLGEIQINTPLSYICIYYIHIHLYASRNELLNTPEIYLYLIIFIQFAIEYLRFYSRVPLIGARQGSLVSVAQYK